MPVAGKRTVRPRPAWLAIVLVAASSLGCRDGGLQVHDLQGPGLTSPLTGERIEQLRATVTATLENRLFVESLRRDDDDRTSEGLLVISPAATEAEIGDVVVISGVVEEQGGNQAELSVTVLRAETIEVVGRTDELAEAEPLHLDGGDVQSLIRQWESLEGHRARLGSGLVVGATNRFGEIVVIAADGPAAARLDRNGALPLDPAQPAQPTIVLDDALVDLPSLAVGDRIGPVTGVVDYRFGRYRIYPQHPLTEIARRPARPREPLASGADQIAVATFNVENLSPEEPDKHRQLARIIVERMASPDIVALQEVQDDTGPADDGVVSADRTLATLIAAIREQSLSSAEGEVVYSGLDLPPADNVDGGQPGANIRVALIYRRDRVSLVESGDGPRRLFERSNAFDQTRKPLLAELSVRGRRLTIVNCHLSSKRGDDPLFGSVQPPRTPSEDQRLAQAVLLGEHVIELLQSNPQARIVLLGDFNDFAWSRPLRQLESAGLSSVAALLGTDSFYTYIYQGQAQALDHILLSPALAAGTGNRAYVLNVNSTQPDAASDHDPLVAHLSWPR